MLSFENIKKILTQNVLIGIDWRIQYVMTIALSCDLMLQS